MGFTKDIKELWDENIEGGEANETNAHRFWFTLACAEKFPSKYETIWYVFVIFAFTFSNFSPLMGRYCWKFRNMKTIVP